jgi:transcription-repair coupling factor (superfamily II helicase)
MNTAMVDENRYIASLKAWIDEGERELRVTGLSGAARPFFLARLLAYIERPCLVVLPQAKDAMRFYREMEFFLPESSILSEPGKRRLYDFPIYDLSPLTGLSPHKDVVTRRLQALYTLATEKNPVVVTSIDAILLRILPKEALIGALEYLEVGEEVEREGLIERLEENGYLRTSLVEERGDYSVRGGVIDVFPPLYSDPLRLEFWGDRLESVRRFDPLSQRSTQHLDEVVLLPANEVIMDKEAVRRARSMGRLPNLGQERVTFSGQEGWLNHFYARLDTLFEYLPRKGLLLFMEPRSIDQETERFIEKFHRDEERFRQDSIERERPFPELEGVLLSPETLRSHCGHYQRILFSELAIEKKGHPFKSVGITGTETLDETLGLRLAGRGRVSLAPLAERIAAWLAIGSRVALVCRTEQQAHRLKEILDNYGVEVEEVVEGWSKVSGGRGVTICLGRLASGFGWPELGIYLVSEDEIFGAKRSSAKVRAGMPEGKLGWTTFSQLKKGDPVVHQDHGIGRYGGLCKMEVEQKINDFVVIEYAENDRLYIPADRISVLQKYIGADEKEPKLDRLGGRSWDLVKKRAKKSIMEIAKQLVEIYALRKYRKGYAFSRPDNAYREFEATFEHEETPDQIKTIDAVLSDMESEQPMDRLVCGDVGFGKTEVAIRAAFKAVMDGKQVALLVPTTVLAEQHHETFKKRMGPYAVRVAVLSRFKTRVEQKEIIAMTRSGKIDILIGTHRLLQKDIGFKDLGLLIVDEEQRFGVRQKEALKKYRALVDVLALTATPIPRTLHLSLMGIRDLSIIETPPQDRLAIQTYLSPYDEPTIIHTIESEMERGGQVFFVHNRVQTIDQMARRVMELVPKARIAVAHGQMKGRDLEETMLRFLRREIDVLVCTTIIESGLDIPSVNTIIINEIDRFGLAQIYQLRGRVGRAKENAYAYLLVSGGARLTREAEKRLRAIMDFSHLGAGVHLAMHDLRIRGGGNILGFSQSGHISAIGYEFYLRLIEQSIAQLKGEEWHEEINPEINVEIPAYLPNDYVSDTDVRLNLYRRLSSLREKSELEDMVEEMHDRFGPSPREVSNLLSVMSLRLLMKKTGISRLDVGGGGLILTFSEDTKVAPERLVRMAGNKPRRLRFLSERKLRIDTGKEVPLEALLEAEKIIRDLDFAGAEGFGAGSLQT